MKLGKQQQQNKKKHFHKRCDAYMNCWNKIVKRFRGKKQQPKIKKETTNNKEESQTYYKSIKTKQTKLKQCANELESIRKKKKPKEYNRKKEEKKKKTKTERNKIYKVAYDVVKITDSHTL